MIAPFDAMSLVLRVCSVGVAISSLEELRRTGDTRPGGILDVEVQLTRRTSLVRLREALPSGSMPGWVTTLTVLRLLAACTLIVGAGVFEVARFGALVVAVTSLLLRFESPVGTHASGAMATSTFVACALGTTVGTARSMGFTLAFIAGLSGLAYFVSGARKIQQPSWRNGEAIQINSTTLMWGNRRTAVVLSAHPRLGFALCWLTMLGECCVPLALVTPPPVSVAILACAAVFHLSIAIEMGLNCFMWSFVATYPAIVYCSSWLHGPHG